MEIARFQYELVLDSARATYHRPKDAPERAVELAKLRTSESVLDRYAALLVSRWDAADRLSNK